MHRAGRRISALLAAILVTSMALPAGTLADAELTVSPLIMELEAEAGEVLTETITATASGDDPIVVELVHADFGFGPDYSPVLISDDAEETTAFSTRGWFSLPRARYRIPAGRSRELPLRIAVPRNTPGGTYLGAALLRVLPPDAPKRGSQVQAVAQTGPLVFIAVEGGEPPKPRVRDFRVPRLQARGPIRPRVVVDNQGDEFFTLEGTIRLKGPSDEDVVEIRRQFVVPGEPRRLQASSGDEDTGPPRLGSQDLEFGRYEVTTRLRIEPTGTTLVAKRTVWIIPTWLRAVALLIAIVALGCILVLARWLMARSRGDDALFVHEGVVEAEHDGDDDLIDDALDEIDETADEHWPPDPDPPHTQP